MKTCPKSHTAYSILQTAFTPTTKILVWGFTLIELLVVVSIIGILTTLVMANLNSARERARDAQRKSDLHNIQTALRLYYNDNSQFPSSLTFNAQWEEDEIEYMALVPNDPLAPTRDYHFTYDSLEDIYELSACLENRSDTKCSGNSSWCGPESGCVYTVKP